jgi:conjugative transposon TraN protein
MKSITLFILTLYCCLSATAQQTTVPLSALPVIGISQNASIHFISPEKISFVDISSPALAGDLPGKNMFRLKVKPDSAGRIRNGDAGTITIVGESFLAQYRLCYLPADKTELITSEVEISPGDMHQLDISGVELSSLQLRSTALSMLSDRGRAPLKSISDYGISIQLNAIASCADFILLDISFYNSTNLPFDVDELRFKIEDRKINKATNLQTIELKPVFQLYPFEYFKKRYRNIYVLKKATFPADKRLNIELSEKQVSGRNLKLSLRYADLLHADTF